jgi:hypothetical protein
VNLTSDQLRAYSQRVGILLRWIVRARKQMDQLGVHGRVRDQTLKAEDALLTLRMAAHYASCRESTGGGGAFDDGDSIRPSRKQK